MEKKKKAPKPVQRGFERAGKGDGLDLIVVRPLDWGKSFHAQRGMACVFWISCQSPRRGHPAFLSAFLRYEAEGEEEFVKFESCH